jgi:hypothetical protein
VQADSALTGDAVANLLSVLAKGQSKLATLNWPRFNDSYRSYYLFKEEVMAYIKDYGHGVGDRSLAEQIKKHCVSKGTAEYLVFADSPQEILDMLGGLFAKPSKLIEDLMEPLKKHKKVPFDDWALGSTSGIPDEGEKHAQRGEETEGLPALRYGEQYRCNNREIAI